MKSLYSTVMSTQYNRCHVEGVTLVLIWDTELIRQDIALGPKDLVYRDRG